MSTPPAEQGSAGPSIPSAAEQLIQELAAFSDQVEAFLDASTIQYRPEDPDSIVIQLWHDYRWGPLDNSGQQLQRQLLESALRVWVSCQNDGRATSRPSRTTAWRATTCCR